MEMSIRPNDYLTVQRRQEKTKETRILTTMLTTMSHRISTKM